MNAHEGIFTMTVYTVQTIPQAAIDTSTFKPETMRRNKADLEEIRLILK